MDCIFFSFQKSVLPLHIKSQHRCLLKRDRLEDLQFNGTYQKYLIDVVVFMFAKYQKKH